MGEQQGTRQMEVATTAGGHWLVSLCWDQARADSSLGEAEMSPPGGCVSPSVSCTLPSGVPVTVPKGPLCSQASSQHTVGPQAHLQDCPHVLSVLLPCWHKSLSVCLDHCRVPPLPCRTHREVEAVLCLHQHVQP